jgi:hypothetical protein
MKKSTINNNLKKIAAILSAVVMIAALLLAFAACIDNPYKTEPVSVTVIVGEKNLTVETTAGKVRDLLTELKAAGEISAFEYAGSKYGAYVTEIDALKGDSLQGTYIALYHDIDDMALQDFASDYSILTKDIGGKAYFYSGLGISLLPVEEGATYVFVLESF